MIKEISAREIGRFIDFGDSLYTNDPQYVPYMRGDLRKTLKKLVFEKKTYKALCRYDSSGRMNGRILLTVGKNKQLATEHCGYYSHFEVVNDYTVFSELMDEAIAAWKDMGAEYVLGSFFPHDPDNRRGILIKGFSLAPMLFTSHNPPYYQEFFEKYGFEKLTNAYEYQYVEKPGVLQKIKDTAEKSIKENDFYISKINLGNIDRDIQDVHTIMETASTQINFEEVLSVEKIKKIFRTWKPFIDPDFAFIARRNKDNTPIGFTLSIPDYFELIGKMNGRLNPRGLLIFLFGKKKITGLRAMMQYVVPEYQHKGISKALYYETKKTVDKRHIRRIMLGTIMEKNMNSNGAILSLGGELARIYRIYYKKI